MTLRELESLKKGDQVTHYGDAYTFVCITEMNDKLFWNLKSSTSKRRTAVLDRATMLNRSSLIDDEDEPCTTEEETRLPNPVTRSWESRNYEETRLMRLTKKKLVEDIITLHDRIIEMQRTNEELLQKNKVLNSDIDVMSEESTKILDAIYLLEGDLRNEKLSRESDNLYHSDYIKELEQKLKKSTVRTITIT